MAISNLTTLDAVKKWVYSTSQPAYTDDTLLQSLIGQISVAIVNYLQRPSLLRRQYTELQSGVGNQRMMLRNWPVVQLISLQAGSQVIPAAPAFNRAGYTLSLWDGTDAGNPQELTLCGYTYPRGLNNVQIVYQAGYCVLNEPYTIASSSVSSADPYGNWAQDDGVYFNTGTAAVPIQGTRLVPVTGTPLTGQYNISASGTTAGTYTFSTADVGRAIVLNYSFVPAPIENACIEWVAERYRYKERIGETSHSLGGTETTAFNLKLPEHIKLMLEPYQKWLPL